ncbi:hypothetical protein [Streptomyces cahuitamycinicus]|uniref:Uncharacterized protein n=1 Tax=Streptomyces cahuitamycinicus TaxID=2070367 RepID=A0A2N8TCD8_9ACTN|nr:hypothetical protein [Streptomyces cahuitamycinicus]PNG16678.1 hypothetical protein C1J00_40630 [Streptomyces cahuitamycinicus]
MYQKPNLDEALANLRTNTADWKTSLAQHTSDERRGKGFAFDVQLLEERDDIAAKIVEDFAKIDEVMSTHRGLGSAAPASWRVDVTPEQIANAKAHWPELAIFDDKVIANMAAVVGIRQVRYMAQVAVRNAPEYLKAREPK